MGGTAYKEAFEQVKPGGRVVSIITQPDKTPGQQNIKAYYVFVQPNGKQLAQIDQLIKEGKVVPPHIEVMPFDQVVDALRKVEDGHVRGKIALKI